MVWWLPMTVKMVNCGLVGVGEDGGEEGVLAWTFPADYFTKGIVFTDPQVQVQRQEEDGRGGGGGGEKKKKKKRVIYQCFTILEVIRQPFLVPNSLVTRQNVNDFSYSWLPLEPRTVTRTVFSPCEVKVGSDGRGKPMRERWGGSRGTSLTSWFIPTPSKE